MLMSALIDYRAIDAMLMLCCAKMPRALIDYATMMREPLLLLMSASDADVYDMLRARCCRHADASAMRALAAPRYCCCC